MNPSHAEWAYDAQGIGHCPRHASEIFERGEPCFACSSDPGQRIDIKEGAAEDVEARAVEAEVRSLAKAMRRTAGEFLEGTGRERIDAVKFADSYAKLTRLWHELHVKRMQVESDERLIEHDRKVAGLRGHN